MADEQRFSRRQVHAVITSQAETLSQFARPTQRLLIRQNSIERPPVCLEFALVFPVDIGSLATHAMQARQRCAHFRVGNPVRMNPCRSSNRGMHGFGAGFVHI